MTSCLDMAIGKGNLSLTVRPAYGRRAPSAEAARWQWEQGQDFQLYGTSTYTSIRDTASLKEYGYKSITVVDARANMWCEILL